MRPSSKLFLLAALLVSGLAIALRYDVELPAMLEGLRSGNHSAHTPLAMMLAGPLARLPYEQAKILWLALQTLSFAAFWLSLAKLYPLLWNPGVRWGWIFVWLIAVNPIHNDFQSNGSLLPIAAALLAAEVFTQSQRRPLKWLGGAGVGALSALSIYPIVIGGLYVVGKERPVKRGFLVGLGLAALAPFVAFGSQTAIARYTALAEAIAAAYLVPIAQVPERFGFPTHLERWFPESVPALFIGIGFHLSIALLYFWYVWGHTRRYDDLRGRHATHLWALGMALMTLLNPELRPSHFIFFVPAFASLFEVVTREFAGRLVSGALGAAIALSALTAQGIVGKVVNDRLELLGLPWLGAWILVAGLAVAVARGRGALRPTT